MPIEKNIRTRHTLAFRTAKAFAEAEQRNIPVIQSGIATIQATEEALKKLLSASTGKRADWVAALTWLMGQKKELPADLYDEVTKLLRDGITAAELTEDAFRELIRVSYAARLEWATMLGHSMERSEEWESFLENLADLGIMSNIFADPALVARYVASGDILEAALIEYRTMKK